MDHRLKLSRHRSKPIRKPSIKLTERDLTPSISRFIMGPRHWLSISSCIPISFATQIQYMTPVNLYSTAISSNQIWESLRNWLGCALLAFHRIAFTNRHQKVTKTLKKIQTRLYQSWCGRLKGRKRSGSTKARLEMTQVNQGQKLCCC